MRSALYNIPEERRCHVLSGGTTSVLQNAQIASGARLSSYSMNDELTFNLLAPTTVGARINP